MIDSQQQDSKERPYICPCGKNYLSYPALFTHIKQKHNGVAPGEITRPKSLNKRGRPRKTANQLANEQVHVLPEYKNPLSNYFYNREHAQNLELAGFDELPAKNKLKPNSDFIPPIPTAHLSYIKNNRAPNRPEPVEVTPSAHMNPNLRRRLKDIFEPIHDGEHLPSQQLQKLIQANRCYQEAKCQERRASRRPIGCERWEMDLRTALLQFLDQCVDALSRLQFKNLELLVGLLLIFYYEMLSDNRNPTTDNYAGYLNNFAKTLLSEVKNDPKYYKVFALEKGVPLQLLSVFHEWLVLEKLSHYDVHLNPNFASEANEEPSASEDQSQQDSSSNEKS